MTNRLVLVLAHLVMCLVGAALHDDALARSRAQAAEMAAFFHDDLAPYGRWLDHPVYGTVWVPQSGRPDWHPYWDGRWVWTRDYGWYWHSNEPYGWATYHYGRWVLTADHGWVWVPDTVWGPAWVEWRYSGGYAGWAPMPPHEEKSKGAAVEARAWVFVPEIDLLKATTAARIGEAETAELLASSSAVAGADLAARVRAEPQSIASVGSAAEQAIAQAKGQVTIYRRPLLPGLSPIAPEGLDLAVPLDTTTEIDPDSVAKAKARLDEAKPPDKPVRGSMESTMGGTFGGEGTVRPAPSSSGGGIGVNVPSVGGVRVGR